MLSEKMLAALNDQINAEYYSSYIYLSMSAYLEDANLPGFANWMRVQADEEMFHVMKFYHYVIERGGKVELKAIDAPQIEWESALAVFENAYEHECYISSRIHNLVKLAREENDYPTEGFLQWFVEEQVEEEASADGVVQTLNRAADSLGVLFMLDREMGQRGLNIPAGMSGAGAAEGE